MLQQITMKILGAFVLLGLYGFCLGERTCCEKVKKQSQYENPQKASLYRSLDKSLLLALYKNCTLNVATRRSHVKQELAVSIYIHTYIHKVHID